MMDTEILAFFFEEVLEILISWEGICMDLERGSGDPSIHLNALFRVAHNIKGSSRSVGLIHVGDYIHHVEDGITLLRDGKISLTPERINTLLEAQELLLNWIKELQKNLEYQAEYQSFLEVYKQKMGLEDAVHSATQAESESVSGSGSKLAEAAPHEAFLSKEKSPSLTAAIPSGGAGRNSRNDESIRVSSSRLDQFIQMIGELSIHQSIAEHAIGQLSDVRAQQAATNAQKLTRELYEKALQLRMQSVSGLFQRLERSARDLSREIGKKVNIQTVGNEVELDKAVLEKILDPLTHIVRNAIDHGVETSETRIAAGKNEFGNMSIEAQQSLDGVTILVKDDGKGLAKEKILKKALEKGLLNPDVRLQDSEIFALIFLPGFSTAEKITDVSGRGVGMDVVAKGVEALRGKIEIQSIEGKGAEFRIHLPTSMSLIDAMIIGIGDEIYAIPTSQMEEVVHVPSLKEKGDLDVISLRDQILPLVPLSHYIRHSIKSSTSKDQRENHSIGILTRAGHRRLVFTADRVLGQRQIVSRPVHSALKNSFGLSGSTILGTGEPAFIIDLQGVAQYHCERNPNKGSSAGVDSVFAA